jgi:hypothetical protein
MGERARERAKGAPLFSEVLSLFDEGIVTLEGVDVRDLPLADFHALRAVLTAAGLVHEETVTFPCKNCERSLTHAPCGAMPLGPFLDHELGDPSLDTSLELGVPHRIVPVATRAGPAETVTLGPVTVRMAEPLFRALARSRLVITGDVVEAMGIVALGEERALRRIARALVLASDDSFADVAAHFTAAHYPPRLFSIAHCEDCGARNDVDAPYEREFTAGEGDGTRESMRTVAGRTARPGFPDFDAFADRARKEAERIFEEEGISDVLFAVEGGVAACDDGGEPLLGGYMPAAPGYELAPNRPHEITLYYRTFRAAHDEDPEFDWEAELLETIEHELEHYFAHGGDDPMDEEEREEIRDEAVRVLGKKTIVRSEVARFRGDLVQFVSRTWPIWILVILATILVTMAER